MKTSSLIFKSRFIFPKIKGSYNTSEFAKRISNNYDLSHPIGDLREQISRRATWETILKTSLYILRLKGVMFGLSLFTLQSRPLKHDFYYSQNSSSYCFS